jgi:hypothetical protein
MVLKVVEMVLNININININIKTAKPPPIKMTANGSIDR